MGRYVFTFTGLAELDGRDTDLWIADQLAGKSGVDAAVQRLQNAADREFAKVKNSGRPLTIVGAGWEKSDSNELRGSIVTVSNVGFPGRRTAGSGFQRQITAIGYRDRFLLIPAGQRLSTDEEKSLTAAIRAAMRSGQPTEVLLMILIRYIRVVAGRNNTVGRNVKIACIPRSAIKLDIKQATIAVLLKQYGKADMVDAVPFDKMSIQNCWGADVMIGPTRSTPYDVIIAGDGTVTGSGVASVTLPVEWPPDHGD
jgi:hypothetical protein